MDFDFFLQGVVLTSNWLPDGKTLLVRARKTPADQPRAWLYDLDTASSRPLTPEGIVNVTLSGDATFVVGNCLNQGTCIYRIPNGEAETVSGLNPNDQVIGPTSEPQWFYVSKSVGLPRVIEQVNVFTGERKPWREITPPDLAGVLLPLNIRITPDGHSYVYTYRRVLADLYLAKGLR